MNRIAAIALFAIATLASTGSASAQFVQTVEKADIPFAFSVSGAILPAGHYQINLREPNLLEINNINHPKFRALVLTSADESRNSGTHSKMIFTAYGDQYFLNQVVCPIWHLNVTADPSKQEKKVRLQLANAHGGQSILVAMK